MAAAAGIPRLASSAAGRAVHVKIYPRPRSITESRQVLRELERFGEVAVFKHLKVWKRRGRRRKGAGEYSHHR